MVLDNKDIYSIILESDKLYSNNQQCKELDLGVDITKADKYFRGLVLESDGKYYDSLLHGSKIELDEITENMKLEYSLLKKEYSILSFKDGIENREVIVLKDGNIYSLTLEDSTDKIVKEEMLYSKENYGYITNAIFAHPDDSYIINGNFKSYDNKIIEIVSDKGIYVLKENVTDECKKYEDVECEEKMELSDIYIKYKKDIKFISRNYTILADNNIIYNNVFFSDIEKIKK